MWLTQPATVASTTETSESTADRRRRYEAVLSVVDLQTTERQLPWLPQRTLIRLRSACGEDVDAVERAIRAAVENGDLLQFRVAGDQVLCLPWESKLERAAVEVATSDDLDKQLLGELNQALGEVRDRE